MSEVIKFPVYGIEVTLGRDAGGKLNGGSITSELHEEVPEEPEGGLNAGDDYEFKYEEWMAAEKYDAAMHAIESLILAHTVAGVDVLSPDYLEGIETAVEACGNHS
jgi:hypothetical protein